jgi:hypothetical protein
MPPLFGDAESASAARAAALLPLMIAATAQESMYLDFMDCPPTKDLAAGISRKTRRRIPT